MITLLGAGAKASYDTELRGGALRDALTKAMANMMNQLENYPWKAKIAKVLASNFILMPAKRQA